MTDHETTSEQDVYRVLARKYRPRHFDDNLIGQDALVRTLKNAITSGRIAHAFMLTGVRGVGKTTTARIIAKALNYAGPDGTAGPTTGPTDDCKICQAISEDRHPDVIEMDAASRTGVDDIREILDGVRYAPSSARYKIYIIDEVHMLSRAAFNALLKTLEEPPEHVKFIFATTEIRKVPVTVLSRCQRFDLRRVGVSELVPHYTSICEQEGVAAEEEAIALIARAADGSVRDGLSLLDQAIALSDGTVTAVQVKDMLGLADRARITDLLGEILRGEAASALSILDDLYAVGGDPMVVLKDLLDQVHLLTRLRVVSGGEGESGTALTSEELVHLGDMARRFGMPALSRAWQILLGGLSEMQHAPNPQAVLEMVVLRLIFTANLPDPGTLIKKLQESGHGSGSPGGRLSGADSGSRAHLQALPGGGGRVAGAALAVHHRPAEDAQEDGQAAALSTIEEIVKALETSGEMILASQVWHFVQPVSIAPGHLSCRILDGAPARLSHDLSRALTAVSGRQWVVSLKGGASDAAPTLAQAAQARKDAELDAARQNPVVKAVLSFYPGAELTLHDKSGEIQTNILVTDHETEEEDSNP